MIRIFPVQGEPLGIQVKVSLDGNKAITESGREFNKNIFGIWEESFTSDIRQGDE